MPKTNVLRKLSDFFAVIGEMIKYFGLFELTAVTIRSFVEYDLLNPLLIASGSVGGFVGLSETLYITRNHYPQKVKEAIEIAHKVVIKSGRFLSLDAF